MVGPEISYADSVFEFESYVVDEIQGDLKDNEYQGASFDGTKSLELGLNHTYGVSMSAYTQLYAAGGPEGTFTSGFATVDPFIGFDQDAFDVLMGSQTFSLQEYYRFVFSENLPIQSASVPEPSTMLLHGFGLAGLWGARKKFRK